MDERQFDHAPEVLGGFLEPREDAPAFFQPADQAFDHVAAPVRGWIKLDRSGGSMVAVLEGILQDPEGFDFIRLRLCLSTRHVRATVDWKTWLEQFGFRPTSGTESLTRVEELERLIGVRLPSDYRDFLLEVGGGYLRDVVVPCTIPTPFGMHNLTCLHSVKEVMGLLDSNKAPRNMLCISHGHFGMTGCLSVAGLDHGQVFSLDTEMRFFWTEEILSRMPDLDPTIREFFRLRDADELPDRPWGYENLYHMANSFAEFLEQFACAKRGPELK